MVMSRMGGQNRTNQKHKKQFGEIWQKKVIFETRGRSENKGKTAKITKKGLKNSQKRFENKSP